MENNKSNIVKPKWDKPKLIVLVKGTQDEAVLSTCKGFMIAAWDPALFYANCFQGSVACAACSLYKDS